VIPRGSRLALFGLALLLAILLLVKGRAPTGKGEGAAFFVTTRPGSVTVRLAGDLPQPGLYLFPDGPWPASAIKMTFPGVQLPATGTPGAGVRLCSGDIVTLRLRRGQPAVLPLGRMPVRSACCPASRSTPI